MDKKSDEWMKQAQYDMKAAATMYNGRTYIYAIFMCHLAIEKALKGLYLERLGTLPPKTHNLNYLMEKTGLELPEDMVEFLPFLNSKSIATRYPEDLQRVRKAYNKKKTGETMDKTRKLLKWIEKQY